MKKHLLIPFVLLASLFFTSCEKEQSIENGGFPGTPVGGGSGSSSGTAVFDFSGGTGACTGAIVSGTYTAGTALAGATNTVSLLVTVDSIGTYTIGTNTLNGITFSASGTFTATGAQTVIFTASGTPAAAGNFNFIPGVDGCTFSITVQAGTTPPPDDCKECIYTPFCEGSWFRFKTNLSGVEGFILNNNLSSTDTTINGQPYSKMNATSDNGTNVVSNSTYFNCNNGVSTVFAYTLTGLAGSTLSFIKSTPIKANEPIGTTWSEVIQNQIGQDVTFQYTILEKGISRTVLGRNYPDVIHIELRQSIDLLGTPIEAGVSQYYYAKGVGVVETTNEAFGLSNSQLLEDYFIP
jgi:hypothetical protein